jgi:hypothetical protein
MTRDNSQFDPEDELSEEPNKTESPTPDAAPGEDDLAPAGDSADDRPMMSALDFPGDLVGDEPDVSALPPVPTDVPEWAAELFAGPSVTPPLPDPSPSSAAQKDGSTTVPGDADPTADNLPPGDAASPRGYEQLRMVHAVEDFGAGSGGTGAASTPPPFLEAVFPGDRGQPPRPRNPGPSSALPSVSVEVQVDFTPAGLVRLAQESTRAGAEFSRKEIGIVARRLDELEEETRTREAHHRAVWDR